VPRPVGAGGGDRGSIFWNIQALVFGDPQKIRKDFTIHVFGGSLRTNENYDYSLVFGAH
jgi:hypothetical protein